LDSNDDRRLTSLIEAQERADKRARVVSGGLFMVLGIPLWVGAFVLFPVLGPTAVLLGVLGFVWLGICVAISWAMTRSAEKRLEDYRQSQRRKT